MTHSWALSSQIMLLFFEGRLSSILVPPTGIIKAIAKQCQGSEALTYSRCLPNPPANDHPQARTKMINSTNEKQAAAKCFQNQEKLFLREVKVGEKLLCLGLNWTREEAWLRKIASSRSGHSLRRNSPVVPMGCNMFDVAGPPFVVSG